MRRMNKTPARRNTLFPESENVCHKRFFYRSLTKIVNAVFAIGHCEK